MPRSARIVIADIPYHITHRGNYRQDVFFSDSDYWAYLAFLRKYTRQYGLSMLGYCLMTNHIHLVSVPKNEKSLALAVGNTHGHHSGRVNARMNRQGSLWHNRFYACSLDEEALWAVLRYVECNPERAGMVQHAWEYPWSSAAAHLGGQDISGILDLPTWFTLWNTNDWREQVSIAHSPQELDVIRQYTATGQPLDIKTLRSKAG